jgi:hypothetical protein
MERQVDPMRYGDALAIEWPRWVRVVVFTTVLLAMTLVALWASHASAS